MELPRGLDTVYDPNLYCCEVVKGIYGLPPSGKVWGDEAAKTLTSLGFERSLSDPCLFFRGDLRSKTFQMVCLYVDDISCYSFEKPVELFSTLKEKYGIKDEGELDFMLGVEVVRDKKGSMALSQGAYVDKVLEKFRMEDCRGVKCPFSDNKLTKAEDEEDADEEKYRSIVGSIACLMVCTRPDLACSVTKLSRHLNAPKGSHMIAAKRVLRYIKQTRDVCLMMPDKNSEEGLEMYVDADHAGCLDTRRSTSGCIITIGGCAVHWRSKRQSVVAKSTAVAEYISLAEGIEELLWIRNMLIEMGLNANIEQSEGDSFGEIPVYEDNIPCINIAENPLLSQKTKSIDLHYHIARHNVFNNTISLKYISTDFQMADILTKPLGPIKIEPFKGKYFKVRRNTSRGSVIV